MLDAIESACQLVADYPGVGRAREEIDKSVMSFPIGSYVIFYYLGDDPFGIARILHGSRDLPTAFHDTYESLATVPWRRFLPETGRAVLESFGSNSLPDLAAPVPRARLSACTVPKEGIVV